MKLTKKVWVIMDKGHKVIATGVPRSRQLDLVDTWDGHRLLTYKSQKKAESAFKVSQFYLRDTEQYMHEAYKHLLTKHEYEWHGEQQVRFYLSQNEHYAEIYEAVEVTITIDI